MKSSFVGDHGKLTCFSIFDCPCVLFVSCFTCHFHTAITHVK